jgi:hypothetical protein
MGDQLVTRPLYLYTNTEKHTQTLNMHALSWIRTHDPGFRASENSACLRPLGYRDRPVLCFDCIRIVSVFVKSVRASS